MNRFFPFLILALILFALIRFLGRPPDTGQAEAFRPAPAEEAGLAAPEPAVDIQGRPESESEPDIPGSKQPRVFSPAANQVLENLFTAYGNRRQPRPRIEVVHDNLGPRYRQSARTIVLDRRALQVCRSFGSDSLSALAFIIGHELAHFFQEAAGGRDGEFSYLAYDKNRGSNQDKERLADIQGLFNAYLAGYRPTDILPELIARLYDAYQLPGRLEGYPALEERQQSSASVLATVDTLSQLYEVSNALAALGHYGLAAAGYRYILKYYPGREIYGNLGANAALYAMFCSRKSPDAYLYPLEIDPDSRLQKPRARGGEEELTEAEKAQRRRLLAEAEANMDQALRLDPAYFPAALGKMCVLLLQGQSEAAEQHFRQRMENDGLPPSEWDKARLALGIALAGSAGQAGREQAEQIFRELASMKQEPALAYMAGHNLKALRGELPEAPRPDGSYNCLLPFELYKVDGISIHRVQAERPTPLPGEARLSFGLEQLSSSTVIQFSRSGRPALNFQWVSGREGHRGVPVPSFAGKNPRIVYASTGFYLICGEEHAVFRFDARGRLAGWGRYYGLGDYY
ncbi:MAG: hypothetical protein KDD10_20990 [Phaeodactylibacter sp.]|nr:hypothetical protein [Phaeodactylibacter sp.]MCB9293501.1 hypothetical protein [Lewinellaceae bacterium]